MRCIVLDGSGGPEVLKVAERPVPALGPDQVLIKVAAAGINFADCHQRRGRSPYADTGLSYSDANRSSNTYRDHADTPEIIGLEVAGHVIAVDPGVEWPRVGMRVCALLPGGGYAEYAPASASLCLPVPDDMDLTVAAAIPETFYTAWDSIFIRGRFAEGESLLVHGGSSGIGTTSISLARAFGAKRIFATVRNEEKAAVCRELGCHRPILYRDEDFVEVINRETAGRGVDVVYDMVGADYFARNLACLAMDGRHVSVATISGARTELDIRSVMAKRLTITGSSLRSRSVAEKAIIAESLRKNVWPRLQEADIRPRIYRAFPLAQASEAHSLMEASQHAGKMVLVL